METEKIAVIGAGAMGTGIAYVCATKGYGVSIRDINGDLAKRICLHGGKTRRGFYEY